MNRSAPSPAQGILCEDLYTDTAAPGRVIGSRASDGSLRQGIDVEGVLSVDSGALRVEPLIEPGWARAAIAYGPFERRPGLALSCFLLNGHNTSQSENLHEEFRWRLLRWLEGSETYGLATRLGQWLKHPRKRRMWRRLRCWWRSRGGGRPMPPLDENFALGWFSAAVVDDPLNTGGDAFVMHATGPENGELWINVAGAPLPAVRGVQNVPIHYVIVLRERGAVFYTASLDRARGCAAYPQMRPVAIEPFDSSDRLFAGFQQSVLGQIGFRLDSRLYGTRVAHWPEATAWCGSAHFADRLSGVAAPGEGWQVHGDWQQGTAGITPLGDDSLALAEAAAPSGLIHLLVEATDEHRGCIELRWRCADSRHYWCLDIGGDGAEIAVVDGGRRQRLAGGADWRLECGCTHSLQLADDGSMICCFLDGRLIGEQRVRDLRFADARGFGIGGVNNPAGIRVRDFEAHARALKMPASLRLGQPWRREGQRLLVEDDFAGPAGPLVGRRTPLGDKTWQRLIGSGSFDLTGSGAAKVRADADRPNPGRSACTIDWDEPGFADIEILLKPPGQARGQGHQGLCGFILWQDPDNYITINTWLKDSYGGASISSFFQLDGFEDLYDAIWTNVGDRVYWGRELSLRVLFDGQHYLVEIDGEPVLYRSLGDVYPGHADLRIHRVGLLANWEWGDDTGSEILRFRGRA